MSTVPNPSLNSPPSHFYSSSPKSVRPSSNAINRHPPPTNHHRNFLSPDHISFHPTGYHHQPAPSHTGILQQQIFGHGTQTFTPHPRHRQPPRKPARFSHLWVGTFASFPNQTNPRSSAMRNSEERCGTKWVRVEGTVVSDPENRDAFRFGRTAEDIEDGKQNDDEEVEWRKSTL